MKFRFLKKSIKFGKVVSSACMSSNAITQIQGKSLSGMHLALKGRYIKVVRMFISIFEKVKQERN
jgi:hypothetical protein